MLTSASPWGMAALRTSLLDNAGIVVDLGPLALPYHAVLTPTLPKTVTPKEMYALCPEPHDDPTLGSRVQLAGVRSSISGFHPCGRFCPLTQRTLSELTPKLPYCKW